MEKYLGNEKVFFNSFIPNEINLCLKTLTTTAEKEHLILILRVGVIHDIGNFHWSGGSLIKYRPEFIYID